MNPISEIETFTNRQIEIMETATRRIDRYGIQNLTIKSLAGDMALSEAALYRHFDSKNDIMAGMLTYFILNLKNKISNGLSLEFEHPADELRNTFSSLFQSFMEKPAIVSVIFSENIFLFDKELSNKVSEIMDIMHQYIEGNIKAGQNSGHYTRTIGASTLTIIIIGSIRLAVLKWKLSGHKGDLNKAGGKILDGILKMTVK